LNFLSLFKRNLIYKFKQKFSVDTDQISLKSLDELFHHYGSDKAEIFKITNQQGHGFSNFYEKKLEKFKNKKINILEIGSYAGSSAAAFVKYLPNSQVFCFDINVSNFKFKSKNIHVFGVDINNEKRIKKILNKIFTDHGFEKFDLIIDDGSHNLKDILIALKLFFKILKKESLYIIEDFKHPNYYKYNNNLEHIFVNEFLDNIERKKISPSSIFNDNDQKNLIDSIKKIESFKGNLKDSDICFVTKK
tara:strand:- start:1437 stop:2180 length:744 start_codon:yes stop_codon:yes gene_type:complete